MIDYSFRDFVEMAYGPFKTDDDIDLFIDERKEVLSEAFDAFLREEDEMESLGGDDK